MIALVITAGFARLAPSHDRRWTEDQSRVPQVRFDGDQVHVTDARRFRYRSPTDWDADWYDATFDLDRIVGADFGVERLSDIDAIAHTFASFRFADGQVLAISVEIRKEVGEVFSPIRGLFRQFELMYVLGDERDLVELRAVHRRDTVYLHPMAGTPEQHRAFLVSLLNGAADLAQRPRWYNTLRASCTTELARHLRTVADLPRDPRIWLPGHSDALAHELGLIRTSSDLAATRRANRIDDRARSAAGQADFSAAIREGRTGP